MKAFTKLFLVFSVAIFSQFNINAQGTITWALTANGNASTSTGLATSPLAVPNTLGAPTINSGGATSTGWVSSGSLNSNQYYEYTVSTSATQTFVISGISFQHTRGTGSWDYTVYYSTNDFSTRAPYASSTTTGSSVPSNFETVQLNQNIPMPANTILRFRVYAWTNSGSTYSNRNFVMTGTTAAALPVTLSSFTAKQTTDNNVSLAWITSSESVNKGFSIERQEEGSGKFQSLGFIASKAEGGNSQTTLAYSFKDVTAKKGTNMYRLVQEDLDGKLTYTEVRVVKLSEQSVSNVYPNPSTGAINISRSNDGKKMNIQVIDQSGKIISQVNNITDANYRMNLPQSGIYTIKMMYPETGEQSIQRIVVQK